MLTDGLVVVWIIVMFLSAVLDSHSDGTHSTAEQSIDSHSDGTHSLQSIHWLSFWRHPFTAVASIDSHSDGTHSPQSIHWLSFWRHPIHCRASIDLSFWRHHSTAEHPLMRLWSKATFVPIKKQTHLHLGMTHDCRRKFINVVYRNTFYLPVSSNWISSMQAVTHAIPACLSA